MTTSIDSQWLLDALSDAAETLAQAIERIESDPRRAAGVLEHEIPELYAKLNFAVNTARIGPAAIDEVDHDELVAWPAAMPFKQRERAQADCRSGDEDSPEQS